MEKTVRSLGGTSTWSATQRSRVTRLIRLITEMKTNPRQAPDTLSGALGISRSQYFQDKMLLEKAFGFKVKCNRAKHSYEILADPYLPILNLKLGEAFALILPVRQLSASGD